MSNRYLQHINNQPQVKVMALVYSGHGLNSAWFITCAAAIFTAAFYFFSCIFGFTGGGRALLKS